MLSVLGRKAAHGGEKARVAKIYLQVHAHKLTAHLNLSKLGYTL